MEAMPMTKVLNDVLTANQSYVEGFGDKGSLAMPPARQFAILTCMDARLDPAKFAGLAEGDAHLRSLLKQSLDTAELRSDGWHDVGRGPGSSEGDFIDWLTIKNQTESVTNDVRRIRSHPLIPSSVAIYGYIYDVKNGQLVEVPEATRAEQNR